MSKTSIQRLGKWKLEKKKEWGKNADFWVKIIRDNLDPFRLRITNKAVINSLGKKKNLKILDAGCGEGYLSRFIAKKGHRVFGIDASQKLIESAKEMEKKKALGIKYSTGDFRKTRFPSSYFDLIVSNQTIHEIPDPEKALKEFQRVLKKEGGIICLFLHPCFDFSPSDLKKRHFALTYFQKLRINKGKYFVGGIVSHSPYFYLHLPLSSWLKIFTKTGFLISNIDEPHPPFNLIKKSKWWRKNFNEPRFILISARKV